MNCYILSEKFKKLKLPNASSAFNLNYISSKVEWKGILEDSRCIYIIDYNSEILDIPEFVARSPSSLTILVLNNGAIIKLNEGIQDYYIWPTEVNEDTLKEIALFISDSNESLLEATSLNRLLNLHYSLQNEHFMLSGQSDHSTLNELNKIYYEKLIDIFHLDGIFSCEFINSNIYHVIHDRIDLPEEYIKEMLKEKSISEGGFFALAYNNSVYYLATLKITNSNLKIIVITKPKNHFSIKYIQTNFDHIKNTHNLLVKNHQLTQRLRLQKQIFDIKSKKGINDIYSLVLGLLQSQFDAQGASILKVDAQSKGNYTLQKLYRHYERFEIVHIRNAGYGYSVDAIKNNSALLITSTENPSEKEDGIGHGFEFDLKEGEFLNATIYNGRYLRANKTIEDEASLMVITIIDPRNKDTIMGTIKIGNFNRPKAFSLTDLLDLQTISKYIALLLIDIEYIQKQKEVAKQRSDEIQLIEKSDVLYFWREVALGSLHQIANHLSSADNGNILIQTIIESIDLGNYRDMARASFKDSRESISKAKKLIKSVHERGGNINPIFSECFILEDIILPAVELLHTRLNDNGIDFAHFYGSYDYVVSLDRELMIEGIINIISNAIDAVSERFKHNSKRERSKKVIILLRKMEEKNELKIVIRDNGIGVGPENIEKLFTPFFTTKGKKGTGLGLFFTRRLIDRFGGRITFEKTYELKGSIVQIVLPYKNKYKRK